MVRYVKKYGFWKQVKPKQYKYGENYNSRLCSPVETNLLRIGWMSAYLGYDYMKTMSVLDFGCGNGGFMRAARPVFKSMEGYDKCPGTLSEEALYGRSWNLITAFDVLEHLPDIDDFFKIDWTICMLSFPETPEVEDWEELRGWRHFKPDEHIWCLDMGNVINWLGKNNCDIIAGACFEDCFRKRWDPDKPNISSILAIRK
jgi:hypothetical protein